MKEKTKNLILSFMLITVFAFIVTIIRHFIGYPVWINWIACAIMGYYESDVLDYLFSTRRQNDVALNKETLDELRRREADVKQGKTLTFAEMMKKLQRRQKEGGK